MIKPNKLVKLSASVSPHLFRHGPECHQEGQDIYEVSYKVTEAKDENKQAAEGNRYEWRWFIPAGCGGFW